MSKSEIVTRMVGGEEWNVRVDYDENGKPWMYQVLGRTNEQWINLPLTDEDRAEGIDEKKRYIGPDGETYVVKVMYNHDPNAPSAAEVFANILKNHYETANKMFGVYIPALEKRLKGQ